LISPTSRHVVLFDIINCSLPPCFFWTRVSSPNLAKLRLRFFLLFPPLREGPFPTQGSIRPVVSASSPNFRHFPSFFFRRIPLIPTTFLSPTSHHFFFSLFIREKTFCGLPVDFKGKTRLALSNNVFYTCPLPWELRTSLLSLSVTIFAEKVSPSLTRPPFSPRRAISSSKVLTPEGTFFP